MQASREGLAFQMALWSGQGQRSACFPRQASAFLNQATGDAAMAGDLAHAEVGQPPVLLAALDQRCAEQAIVETPGHQQAVGQAAFHQFRRIGVGRQQPVRSIGVNFRQVAAILLGRAIQGLYDHGHWGSWRALRTRLGSVNPADRRR